MRKFVTNFCLDTSNLPYNGTRISNPRIRWKNCQDVQVGKRTCTHCTVHSTMHIKYDSVSCILVVYEFQNETKRQLFFYVRLSSNLWISDFAVTQSTNFV